LIARLAKLFGSRPTVDESLLDQIEEVLITSDVGVKTSERILAKLREQMSSGELTDADSVWKSLRQLAVEVLDVPAKPIELANKPSLMLIVGVNGAGKTTTIGKLAARYAARGRKVLLAAGDTFRAAAVFQLEVWAKRVNCPVVTGKEGADPGAVIFDAVKKAQAEGFDLVIADTAGRLHTKVPLMEELKKVDRTAQKALGGRGADEILLVLDATTGQNAVQQMHMFREALQVSGVVLTKLDGTAKGGMILGIVDEHRIPVRFIGLGERIEDLREFDATSFVEALFAKPDGEILAA
jgi:fused signal recognition particle receptor